ncbi:hypothetical protein LF1_48690 [Rubripirellula obstinata]|uniref:Uncharacterized protein n=1 Tax=Rubripirellula obstinata TaxID=406547 RepID=A0A5B1CQR3_9BACT|nr:hypothetical protein [Rubripirellula obstinata]KAA1262305.1 hypothetical protein LF1_48690 [Rubripirellula obstinata]
MKQLAKRFYGLLDRYGLECCPGVNVDTQNGIPIARRGGAYFTLTYRYRDDVTVHGIKRALSFLCPRKAR